MNDVPINPKNLKLGTKFCKKMRLYIHTHISDNKVAANRNVYKNVIIVLVYMIEVHAVDCCNG